jgi:hypothetical protein
LPVGEFPTGHEESLHRVRVRPTDEGYAHHCVGKGVNSKVGFVLVVAALDHVEQTVVVSVMAFLAGIGQRGGDLLSIIRDLLAPRG